jgi:carbohydrate-binding DOMON domain-containing protein
MKKSLVCIALMACALITLPASAGIVTYEDPGVDDFGPGTYTYPTDAVYLRGSFDIKRLEVKNKGSKVEFKLTLAQRIEDPWNSLGWPEKGNGFSIQMAQIYIDTTPEKGHTETLPGINAVFDKKDAWDKVILISPQAASRVRQEVKDKAPTLANNVIVPTRIRVRGKTLIVTVKKRDLGSSFNPAWGLQTVMQSNEGFPAKEHLLSRRVNEYRGQHRFGGGSDYDCDPHVLDILTLDAKGAEAESDAQKKSLAYTCGTEGKLVKSATLPMVRRP